MAREMKSDRPPEKPMQYCTRCVYPASSAFPLTFDEAGVCSGCRVADQFRREVNFDARWKELQSLVDAHRSSDGYDIVCPVSGGKDSYFIVHTCVEELNLKPLLVTYHGNNYSPEAEINLHRMRDTFDCDHIVVQPSVETLVKLNRLGFRVHGDMNWHNHAGLNTVPHQVAVRYKVPLVLWGEHGTTDLAGMFSAHDRVEFTKKHRLEHNLHGFDWHDFTDNGLERLGFGDYKEGLTAKDLQCFQYPSDEEILDTGLRGLYLGNYVPWDANKHTQMMIDLYGWRPFEAPSERTYRMVSNLDDIHENGAHDYLKYIKFGYGRATDHASKDIRRGHMSREEGIEMVRTYDAVRPKKDLARWLGYVEMTEEEFDAIADTFRDPRVWWKNDEDRWTKDNIWDFEARRQSAAATVR